MTHPILGEYKGISIGWQMVKDNIKVLAQEFPHSDSRERIIYVYRSL
jgi:hypothetical protein